MDIAYTLAQDISTLALDKVSRADVVIAVLHDRNLNVMYEVALRHVLRDEMILVVKGDPKHEVPVYLRDKAYLVDDGTGEVTKTIDFIARSNARAVGALAFSDPAPPAMLVQAIDEFAAEEQKRLGAALEEIIGAGPRRLPLLSPAAGLRQPERPEPLPLGLGGAPLLPRDHGQDRLEADELSRLPQYDASAIADGRAPSSSTRTRNS